METKLEKEKIQNMAKNGKKSARGIIAIANTSQLMANENKMKKYDAYSEVTQHTLIKSVNKMDNTFVSFDMVKDKSPITLPNFKTEPTTPNAERRFGVSHTPYHGSN